MNEKRDEFARGWHDCRYYRGQEKNASTEYVRGFNTCLEAYHKALERHTGWEGVPIHPTSE